jgi:excisionase family DNA binding protein
VEKTLLTLDEAAASLSVGRTTLRTLIRNGDIRAIRIGAAVRVPAVEITRWIDDQIDHLKGAETGS